MSPKQFLYEYLHYRSMTYVKAMVISIVRIVICFSAEWWATLFFYSLWAMATIIGTYSHGPFIIWGCIWLHMSGY